ncbi:hypothetical protein J4573_44500 [Actinomadura barringtoniae]|uniref:Uncharacterized protein n=1 Tax=Actinomadura barringtoniae TaxID=1427535 RepID=A0A939PLD4_9ACTN|nr:hypothetical protein [Actinomadura barringtoniae]MBO2454213.1 hypothetical protein [Actinomadura barringtoniae]
MTTIVIVIACFAAALLLVFVVGLLLARSGTGPWRTGDPATDEVRKAAEADAAAVQSDRKYFRPDSPGADRDDL